MDASDFKYKTRFDFPIRTVYATEQGKYISNASLQEIKGLAPSEDLIKSNYDLLYNVFNAAVVNRVNKNDDGIDSSTAASIYQSFVHKPCNLEHKRDLVVGHIISAGFASYKGNSVLGHEEALGTTDPYYLSLGAVVYKLVDPEFCDMLIEASDETSASYNAISTSWELGFNSYVIALGSRDLNQARLISDDKDVQAYSKYLRAYGGSGKLDDGTPVYRIITGNVLPLGIGYTTSPAADVQGVLVLDNSETTLAAEEEQPTNVEEMPVVEELLDAAASVNDPALQQNSTIQLENKNISSQTKTNTVKTNSIMKITRIEDITEEALSKNEVSAASFNEFFQDQLDKASTEYGKKLDKVKAELEARENEVKAKEQENDEVKQTVADLNRQLEDLKNQLESEKNARVSEKAQADFSNRMSALESEYNLSDKDRAIIAKNIREKDDDAYAAWLEDWKVIAETKHKSFKPATENTASASTVEAVLDTAVASTPSAANVLADDARKGKWAEAFKLEDIVAI